ncbi:hypothetical protein [Enterobacter quasiroggenkampii]|uniref:hypothetical protein n=1 Tax=Enterobacter quasiroggenkampii TaxID=2497436 RepID=UPI0021D31019|nr:hypothetical protein [Enterobacter quasiroggenkampii]MCU6307545.1 hypothetical protein [Enterobacter quasiroggenkampii]MCU6401054.1 hypothetical protein [Enterobacter quasiroggenkampii]
MKENLNLLFNKLIHKAFPEFSNKVTWTLITFGVGVLALPAPTYLIFINLIIDFYNKQTNSNISLININSITPSGSIGLTLIILGLMYHLIIKGFQVFHEIAQEKQINITNEIKRKSDIKLYEKFLSILPTTSQSITLLKEHDFGNPFHDNSIKDIEKMSYEWGHADQHFHDTEIESKATKLSNDIQNFNNFLALRSHYIHSGPTLTMLTERDRANDFEWLPQTEENVREANERSANIYKDYCDFISTCKNKLLI